MLVFKAYALAAEEKEVGRRREPVPRTLDGLQHAAVYRCCSQLWSFESEVDPEPSILGREFSRIHGILENSARSELGKSPSCKVFFHFE
jgi:hypothetical protein